MSTTSANRVPPDLIHFIRDEAERDADQLGGFLASLGIVAPPDKPFKLPLSHLLDLSAAVRLLHWEEAGIQVHRESGLPPAEVVLRDVIDGALSAGVGGGADPAWHARVFEATISRFAWAARKAFGTDIQLGFPNEDDLVEAMAQILWSHRPQVATDDPGVAP